jgi:hypothetical protein
LSDATNAEIAIQERGGKLTVEEESKAFCAVLILQVDSRWR